LSGSFARRWGEDGIKKTSGELLRLLGRANDFANAFRASYPEASDSASGGARACCRAALLLLDEPFGRLDPLTRASLQREFGELNRRLNKTACFCHPDVREALLLGFAFGLMDAGQLLLLETGGLSPIEK